MENIRMIKLNTMKHLPVLPEVFFGKMGNLNVLLGIPQYSRSGLLDHIQYVSASQLIRGISSHLT